MQLNNAQDKRRALTAATLTLIGGGSAGVAQAEDAPGTWDFDTAVLVYTESDSRVQAIEPVIKGTYSLGGRRYFTGKLVLDSLTGSSPNGATPASTPQTFSGASGTTTGYSTPAYETPLDDRFKDTRFAAVLDYSFPVSDNGTLGVGINGSSEYDFLSLGGNVRYAHDFFQHNTTLSAGLSFEADTIDPVGGVPFPLAEMMASNNNGGGDDENEDDDDHDGRDDGSSDSKTVTDLVFGWTQVLDPNSLLQLNYSISSSSGYQNDPYKILSVVGSDGEPLRYVYESRPDSRTKNAVFARYKRLLFDRDIVDVSYRYMTDDWGIDSHTVDLAYRWAFTEHYYVEPHLRWYTQTAADFYRVALYDGEENTVDNASADTRLAQFDAYTAGFKIGSAYTHGGDWSARLEWYQQSPSITGVPDQAAQGLSKFDLQPDLSAVMLTLGYHFKW
jgi:hypothetical protein